METRQFRSSDLVSPEIASELFSHISAIFSKHRIEIRFAQPGEIDGLYGQVQYFRQNNGFLILMCPSIKTMDRLASTLCHELGHVEMISNLQYLNYHFAPNDDADIERLTKYVRTAMKAELKADALGRKYMAMLFSMPYISAYGSWSAQRYFRKSTILPYKQRLDDLLLAKNLSRLAS